MDKRKLVNIIVKDLAEIKLLAEEVADSQHDSSLIIHLALNRARLLCQEIELLNELNEKTAPFQRDKKKAGYDTEDEADEVASDLPYSDPELEILNFEERDFSVSDQSFEPAEEADETVEDQEEDLEDEEQENELTEENLEDEQQDLEEDIEDEDLEQEEDDLTEEDLEEEDLTEEDEEQLAHDLVDEEDDLTEEEDMEDEEEDGTEEPKEELEQEPEIQHTELKNDLPPGMREIHIDDQDDEYEIEPLRSAPMAGSPFRPPMREIPKPEETEPVKPEKLVVGEKFQNQRSLNDSIGENQSIDSQRTNNRIASLRAAIGLNDRFLFIREIFDNNSEKYNTIIEKLDKMETIQEAVEFLKANLTMEKNEASMKFVELLKRRFPK